VSSPVVFRHFNEHGGVIAPRADPSRDNYCAQRNETFLSNARPGSVKMHVQVIKRKNAHIGYGLPTFTPNHNSVEIPTICNFVIEFIIPNFIEGSTCFERHTAHHQEL
jgi:hypothetical protein